MADDSFRLFPFQEEAAEALRDAALGWIAYASRNGPPKYGPSPIPFLGQLKAVTGSGKTPVLAETVGSLGDGVVLWTTRSSAVVEQTFANLSGRYRPLLPANTTILRDIPSQIVWRELIDDSTGLTIWVLTVASWNEADADSNGSADARLRLRRPQPDWAGEGSPWDQLREELKRPLWIVSDESHNQSAVQLDQLAALGPQGFFMASATPLVNDLFNEWSKALDANDETRALLRAGVVPISTRDVVDANLLKTTIEVIDFRSGTEESLDGALAALRRVQDAADCEAASVIPRAIYVVEKSNPPRGSAEEARPVVIWRHLRERGVPAEEIAIFTDTRELPEGAERVSSLSQLEPRYRHIIFNQTLQEGWDDPEAYVCYFDGATNSFVRIRQIVGRVLRQPTARRFESEPLNTATLILQTPAESYDTVVEELRAELRLYAPEDEPTFETIRVKTRKEPLTPISVKPRSKKLSLPRRALLAPSMTRIDAMLKASADRPWSQEARDAPGTGSKTVVSLADGTDKRTSIDVLRSARTQNGAFLRRRILQRNAFCVQNIHPDRFQGPAFQQSSCHGSQAQDDLTALAAGIVDHFEDRVGYQDDPDPDRKLWKIDEYRPRATEMVDFERAAHARYSRKDFNNDEIAFARAIDRRKSVTWSRNPATSNQGYGIPLPKKVGDSSTFYPDFLIWFKDTCWAVDTTGRHLLDEKVRGKLVSLETPRMALVVRGEVDLGSGSREGKDGWSLVIGRANLKPIVEHADDLDALIDLLLSESTTP
jgi:type III restriction enzyme